MTVSTHVLDASLGRPARDVPVSLFQQHVSGDWRELLRGTTDADGRLKAVSSTGEPLQLNHGIHRIDFETATYFASSGQTGFYPQVSIIFEVLDPSAHYHVPLLLSPFAYSTYRGS
ncbi:MAG TPA: hydroxyisourate hydrolase [Nocardioidaceae bacterium]|nr:hydroxyisourate hydrolase [Nocardioidaceae bacterium]